MRIGVNCFLLNTDIGGIKQYFLHLFKELLREDCGNQYVFFYFSHNVEELDSMGDTGWQRNAILLKDQAEIKFHLDKIDLYFCPFSSLWPRPLPIPTVVTLVDIQEVFYPEFFSPQDLMNRAYHYVASTKNADRVVTISDFSKNTIVKHHRLPNEKVVVAHLCVDERFYRAGEVACPPQKELPEKFLFFPANRWHHKNHDLLLKAIQWLKQEKQHTINAVFTGFDKENGYPVMDKAIEYGISDQVYQLGYLAEEELAYLYLKAEMLVFPSLFEGFGLPLVEAMAAGCPVLAARATSLPEIGGDSVHYFDPTSVRELADGILEISGNSRLRQELSRRGRQRALEFSPAKLAACHLRAFEEAARAYSFSRYLWNCCYEYFHKARVAFTFRHLRKR